MSVKAPLIKKVYVSLDSLLDVRLGTLVMLDPEFAFDISLQPQYYLREEDLFETVDQGALSKENYKAVLEKFPEEIIGHSIVTKVPEFVKQLCCALTEKAVNNPHVGEIEVEINLHPYVLSEEEITALIQACVFHFSEYFSIQVISKPVAEMDMAYVAENYYAMVMYDPMPWINAHQRQLQKGKFKDLAIYCPRINHVRSFSDEERSELIEKGTDIYRFLQSLMAPVLRLEYLPVAIFSADTALNNPKSLQASVEESTDKPA